MTSKVHAYKALQQKVEDAINDLDLERQPPELYEPVKYVLNLGGKRIRPVVTLMSCDLFEGSIEEGLWPAIGLEIFHNFTLLHDDIMDQAKIRRGHPTVHEKWNANNAILSGDLMQVIANQHMTCVGDDILREVLTLYNQTAIHVCEGQQLDMEFEKRDDTSLNDYLRMIQLKTATLLATALKLGAIIGRASENNKKHMHQFGVNLGIAFQIQDDLLDTFGESEQFGKTIGGDIRAGKKTYLILKAQEKANKAQKAQLKNLLENAEMDVQEKVNQVKSLLDTLNIPETTQNERDRYFGMALSELEEISAPTERKTSLKNLAEYIMKRQA